MGGGRGRGGGGGGGGREAEILLESHTSTHLNPQLQVG